MLKRAHLSDEPALRVQFLAMQFSFLALLLGLIFIRSVSGLDPPNNIEKRSDDRVTIKVTTNQPFSEPAIVIQLIFSNSYESVRSYWTDITKTEVANLLSKMFGVIVSRIRDLEMLPDGKGRTLITFTLDSGGDISSTNKIALNFFSATPSLSQEISLKVAEGISIEQLENYCNWTVGRCAMDRNCQSTNCPAQIEQNNTNGGNSALFALLVIPIVIVLIGIVLFLLWYCIYRKPSETPKIELTELGYMQTKSKYGGTTATRKGTISGMSLAESGVRNQVYTIMGDKFGFSFQNGDFSGEKHSDEYS